MEAVEIVGDKTEGIGKYRVMLADLCIIIIWTDSFEDESCNHREYC